MSDRYTKVSDQPHHLLLLGGEPGEHQLRRDVQPSRHHAVEEGTLHHLRRGNAQHTGARCRGKVCARGGSALIMTCVGGLKLMRGYTRRALNVFKCSKTFCSYRFCATLKLLFSVSFEVTPMSDRDFGRYNCTARNNIGMRYQEFILAQAGEFASLALITTSVVSVQFPKCMESGFLHILIQGSHSNCSNAVSLLTLMVFFEFLRKINSTTTPNPYSA